MADTAKGLLVVEKFFQRTPDGPVLVGSKCKVCGKVFFPQKKVCTQCFRDDVLEIHPLAKRGVQSAIRQRDQDAAEYLDYPNREL